jgi:hypothetical protein
MIKEVHAKCPVNINKIDMHISFNCTNRENLLEELIMSKVVLTNLVSQPIN